jgi:hypothetical protein
MTDYWGKDQLTPFNFYDEQNASFGDYLTSPIIQHELKWPIPRKPPPAPPAESTTESTVTSTKAPTSKVESFQVAGITESQIILFLLIIIVVINIAMAIHMSRCLEISTLLLASRK